MSEVKRSTQVSGWLYIFITVAILSASYVTFAATDSNTGAATSSDQTASSLGIANMIRGRK